jgi:Zn-dependent peptidase ImmA (M78 family)
MSTVKKGNAFENKSYTLIKKAIDEGILGVIPAQCKVFQKKGYYSKDRESNIIFDLTIEVWPLGAKNYTLLIIVECKSYSHRVPVNDVEEFHSKISQVAGSKGILITDSLFQEGAFKFARSKGLMLIQVEANETYNIILHRTNTIGKAYQYRENYISRKEDYNNLVWESKIKSLIEGLFNALISSDQKPNTPITDLKRLSREGIEKETYNIIKAYDSNILASFSSMSILDFCSYMEQNYGLSFEFSLSLPLDAKGREILGFYDAQEKTIYVDRTLVDTSRFGFVLAHELGHFFLHSNLTISQEAYNDFSDPEFNFMLDKYELANERHWIEWQANQFAASLLMPKEPLVLHLIFIQLKLGISRNIGKIYLDDQPVNQKDFRKIITYLSHYFNVSKTSVRYRLFSIGCLIHGNKTGIHWTNYFRESLEINISSKY